MATGGKNGRPFKKIDKELFEKLCQIFCSKNEICDAFECNEQTLTEWCKRTYNMGFSDIYKEKKSGGRVSLRRMQYKKAMAGSDTMLIWLGKNYLEQADKSQTEVSGRNGGPIEIDNARERIERKLASMSTRKGTPSDPE